MIAKPSLRGFTLIELMVVVAIIGILASGAYPSYLEHVRKTKRAIAQQFLMEVASRQEQYRADAYRYASLSTLGLTPPPEVNLTHYNFTVDFDASKPQEFIATATAVNSQEVDGNLTINQAGVKTGKW